MADEKTFMEKKTDQDFLDTFDQYENIEYDYEVRNHEVCPLYDEVCARHKCMLWDKGCLVRKALIKIIDK